MASGRDREIYITKPSSLNLHSSGRKGYTHRMTGMVSPVKQHRTGHRRHGRGCGVGTLCPRDSKGRVSLLGHRTSQRLTPSASFWLSPKLQVGCCSAPGISFTWIQAQGAPWTSNIPSRAPEGKKEGQATRPPGWAPHPARGTIPPLPFRWLQLSQHQLNTNDRDVSPLPWTEDIWERLYCPPAGGGRAEEHAIINSLHVS